MGGLWSEGRKEWSRRGGGLGAPVFEPGSLAPEQAPGSAVLAADGKAAIGTEVQVSL